MDLLFADVISNFGRTVMNILAVAGGFLIGNLFALILCRLAAKFALKNRLPYWLEGLLRVIGGLIVAILVAYFVFGDGNWGFGGSGGGRPGGPGGTSSQQKNDNPDDPKDKPKEEPKPKIDLKPTDETIRITVLRGSDFPKSFRLEGSDETRDSETLRTALQERVRAGKGKLKSVTFILHKNSSAEESPVVEEMKRFVTSLGLDVTISNVPEALP